MQLRTLSNMGPTNHKKSRSRTHLASKPLGPVLELLADSAQVARDIEDVLRVGVKLGEDGLLAYAHLEILEDDVDDPLHLARVRLVDQLGQDGGLGIPVISNARALEGADLSRIKRYNTNRPTTKRRAEARHDCVIWACFEESNQVRNLTPSKHNSK